MRPSNTLSLLAATGLLAAAPAAASAAQAAYGAPAPVAIAACSTFAGTPVSSSAFGTTIGFANFGSYSVSFVNRSNIAAKHIALDIDSGRAVQRIDENGSFAPGMRIDKDGSQPFYATGFDGRKPHCSVAEVDFVDGSTWHATPLTALSEPAVAREVVRT